MGKPENAGNWFPEKEIGQKEARIKPVTSCSYGKSCMQSIELPTNSGRVNPLPYMPILGSFDSAANKDGMAKTWTNGDTIF